MPIKLQPIPLTPAPPLPDDGVVIGHVAAGTTVTQAMLDMMIADHFAGRPPAHYMDLKPGVLVTRAFVDEQGTLEIGTVPIEEWYQR
jgi:hypothetical protein